MALGPDVWAGIALGILAFFLVLCWVVFGIRLLQRKANKPIAPAVDTGKSEKLRATVGLVPLGTPSAVPLLLAANQGLSPDPAYPTEQWQETERKRSAVFPQSSRQWPQLNLSPHPSPSPPLLRPPRGRDRPRFYFNRSNSLFPKRLHFTPVTMVCVLGYVFADL